MENNHPIASTAAPISLLQGFRATTIIKMGADASLPGLIAALNGENNLIVIEPDDARFRRYLGDNEVPITPGSFYWISCLEDLVLLNLPRFILAGTHVIVGERSELALHFLRHLKQVVEQVDAQRPAQPTYLAMVTYNRLAFTQMTLNRLRKNAEVPFRLVILDNGSADGTVEWLGTHAADYPFIERIFYFHTNLGIGRALNNGMRYALSRSNAVGRIDNDVLVPPRWLADLQTVLAAEPTPGVVAGCITDDDVARTQLTQATSRLVDHLKVFDVEVAGGFLNLFQPDVFNRFGFFPETPLYGVEDGGLCKAVRKAGERVSVVDNVKVEHLPAILGESSDYRHFKSEELNRFYRTQTP